jgi:TRAP-type C4-dicarboxylate transport system substrate-binding protein
MFTTRGAFALAALLVLAPGVHGAPWTALDATPEHGAAASSVRAFAAALAAATGAPMRVVSAGGDAGQAVASVAAGQVAVGVFPLRVLERDDPALGMARVPFLATSFVDARKLWRVLRPRVEAALAARGLTLLYGVPTPPAALLSRQAIASIAAWRGVTLLLADPGLDALARLLGAQPVSGAPARVALGDGRAQAVFAAADVAARDRAWDYASHYLHAPAWFPVHLVAVNRGALAALASAQRDAVLSAADAAAAPAWAQAERDTEEAIQKLRDYGLKTAPAPVNMLIQLEAIGRELLFQWSEGAGEAGAELVESYYAIR